MFGAETVPASIEIARRMCNSTPKVNAQENEQNNQNIADVNINEDETVNAEVEESQEIPTAETEESYETAETAENEGAEEQDAQEPVQEEE